MESRKNILIADDDRNILDMLATLLEENGFSAETAADGSEAYAKAIQSPHDLIILDIHMPSFNGLEILKELRGRKIPTPIIMISAQSTRATLENAFTFGSVTFLEKPFSNTVLLDRIHSALKSAEQRHRKNRRVLVADDHQGSRDLLKTILDEAGYDVDTASDGEEAVNLAQRRKPHYDMAVIDINMPKLKGDRVVEIMAKMSPETVLILLTGEASRSDIQEGYKKGAYTLIRKPFDVNALLFAFASYERESDKQRHVVRQQEAYRRLPFYRKWIIGFRNAINAPVSTRKGMAVRTLIIVILSMVIGLLFLKVATTVEKTLNDGQAKMFRFFENVEGYLYRDEQREIDHPRDRPFH